ncbi:NAD(P)-binding protein [Mollisia scopiformis]|uniref:NAD(P)-binding protein n=1 Tax=Mollisia scopiformis TaxID=149040 RepID=A0A194XCX1_MOLSC|nr:NAD(P)-binding protein [Mollisia scopiformis]KUJ18018.1 NAD(P)-binding protein [Mollisia scopiformis]
MMRIAIAGSGGLARTFVAHILETANICLVLSREPQPDLEGPDCQVAVVDYDDQDLLRFTLRGVDVVISTVSGNPQINLIDAAAHSGVRRFVPAEFEGPPSRRPRNDPLDRGRAACLERLRHYKHHHRYPMASTVFTCGVFYERFARGGLGAFNIGASSNVFYQGSYLMDVENGTAEVVEQHSDGRPVNVTMTSINDVARFVVAALDLDIDTWQDEFSMSGDRISVAQIVQWAESIKGATFFAEVIAAGDLNAHLEYATFQSDFAKVARMHELIATEQRRYDFRSPNLNALVPIVPETFWDWLRTHWG